MSFSYARQGNCCEPHTLSSRTSNAKYIMPMSKVYHGQDTTMMRYPGHDSMHSADAKPKSNEGDTRNISYDTKPDGCASCKSLH